MPRTTRATTTAVKPVGALQSGLRILRYLAATGAPLGVTRVARDLQLNPSSCFNLLRTLASEGMVRFDEEAKTYSIALGAVELARGALDRASHARLVRPELDEVALRYGVTVALWQCIDEEQVMLVDIAESGSSVRILMNIGQRYPMYVAALGRCIAAVSGLDRAALLRKFATLRWDSPPSFDAYLASVEEARERGYGVDHENFKRGLTTLSAVIVDERGAPAMAFSSVALSAQMTPEIIGELGADLHHRALRISRALFAGPKALAATALRPTDPEAADPTNAPVALAAATLSPKPAAPARRRRSLP